jgi:hypothetical protein
LGHNWFASAIVSKLADGCDAANDHRDRSGM